MMTVGRPPLRPLKRVLVANRGEIASRIIVTLREYHHPIEIVALYTSEDTSHTLHATTRLELPSASSYLDQDLIISLARDNAVDAIHPGYGFLSESAGFARRAWQEASISVIGPGWDILQRTGDKLAAKNLALQCKVPVLPGTTKPCRDVEQVKDWLGRTKAAFPIMVKSVDGGGGRGIRIVREEKDLENLVERALADSPSRQVFVEKAAANNFRHVEVQIAGDGTGECVHLWERECSIQRRYQKVVEIAPSTIEDRGFVGKIISAALTMAESVRYFSLGTFEFLANPHTKEFFFLEINPRLQVEHTITEELAGSIDIVRLQLEIAEGGTFSDSSSLSIPHSLIAQNAPTSPPPERHSIQLRVTAENTSADFSLSVGRISSFHLPSSGGGIRLETSLVQGHPYVVGPDFDSLLAKIIVTAITWPAAVRKAQRCLLDTHITGVKTNLSILRGIVSSSDFLSGACDTSWLETQLLSLQAAGDDLTSKQTEASFFTMSPSSFSSTSNASSMQGSSSSTILFRKGDAWSLALTPAAPPSSPPPQQKENHHLKLTRVLRNDFPNALTAEIEYTGPSGIPAPYQLELTATTATSAATASLLRHRAGQPGNPTHVVIPFPGKLVEICVEEDDVVAAGDVVAVVSQMKMELEVRTAAAGRVVWVMDVEEGGDVGEGILAAELKLEPETGDVAKKNAEGGKAKL